MCSTTRGHLPWWHLTRRGAALAAVTVSAAGCAGGSDMAAASEVASGFHAAVSQRDGAVACSLMAPQTRVELTQSAEQPCPAAVLEEDIPEVGRVRTSGIFGSQAQVRLAGDTVFLAEFPGGWRVVAAACRPRPPLPYDCQIKGV